MTTIDEIHAVLGARDSEKSFGAIGSEKMNRSSTPINSSLPGHFTNHLTDTSVNLRAAAQSENKRRQYRLFDNFDEPAVKSIPSINEPSGSLKHQDKSNWIHNIFSDAQQEVETTSDSINQEVGEAGSAQFSKYMTDV